MHRKHPRLVEDAVLLAAATLAILTLIAFLAAPAATGLLSTG